MDGFHLYKSQLDSKSLSRRGAHFTFDSRKLYEKLAGIKSWQSEGLFPSFEHGVGDPVQDDIKVDKYHNVIIVEGLYMAYASGGEYWRKIQEEILHETWFIDVSLNESLERLKERHMRTWNMSEPEALKKIERNDEINAKLVLTTKCNADYLVSSKSVDDWYIRENPLRKRRKHDQNQDNNKE